MVYKYILKEDAGEKFTPYLAYKVTFEGTDAIRARIAPKILQVDFITDKKKLSELVKLLKKLPKAGE